MAIYHLSVQMISRSGGRSAVAAAAYRAGERLREETTGLSFDYRQKKDIVAKAILAPAQTPSWAMDRATLWNRVEAFERRKDAQLCREVRVALPAELSLDEQRELLEGYLQDQFVRLGMVADYAIHHDNPKNPHAHVMLTTRRVDGDDFGPKETAWNARALLMTWREEWAQATNRALAIAGHDVRVDARSYEAQGLRLIPGIKLGVGLKEQVRDQRDVIAERLRTQAAILRANGKAIEQDPTVALEALTRQQATFTAAQLRRFLRTRTANEAQLVRCMDATLSHPTLVRLGQDRRGAYRLTSRGMLQAERSLFTAADVLAPEASRKQPSEPLTPRTLQHLGRASGVTLSTEQRVALAEILRSDRRLIVVEGTAGSGKSTVLKAARASWMASGYSVHGATLAGAAAANLEASVGIGARTLASWGHYWATGGRQGLGHDQVLVVDEAGLLGTRQLANLLARVKETGGRLVLVGDSAQLQAIEAGAPLRALGQRVGKTELHEIRRQHARWQQVASIALAKGEVRVAFAAYETRGFAHAHATQADAIDAVLKAWKQQSESDPACTRVLLAYRRDEVQALNEAARALLKQSGELGREHLVQTERGLRAFAEGERLMFLRNDRGLGVTNGTLGTLERVRGQGLQVRLDGAESRRVVVDAQAYRALDYGYASTVHKAQGLTVDHAHVLLGPSYDRHAGYVAMTRHRQSVQVHYSHEACGSRAELLARLSRAAFKDVAHDYVQNVPGFIPSTERTDLKEAQMPESASATPGDLESRLWRARAVLAERELSFSAALDQMPSVKTAKVSCEQASGEMGMLAQIRAAYERAHPFKARFGLSEPRVIVAGHRREVRLTKAEQMAAKWHERSQNELVTALGATANKRDAKALQQRQTERKRHAQQEISQLEPWRKRAEQARAHQRLREREFDGLER